MAGAGIRLFEAGSILTANQVNTYLMDQVVARFATIGARDAAFGSPGQPALAEGRLCYLDSTNKVYIYTGSAWEEIGSQIEAGEVGETELANNAVTSAKIANGTILNEDISSSASIALSKLATGALPTDITVASANIVNGTIVDADISSSAAIADTKLATISTASKVSNSATTATSANTNSAIVARDSSGNFVAGKATLSTVDVATVIETATISASAATGTINIDFSTNPTVYYTVSATNDWTINIRGTSGTTLNSVLSTGQIATVTFLATIGATQKRPTVFQVDGSAVTPKWMGGTAPTSGNASSIDVYTITVIKTGNAAFTMLAGQTRFA
jgi:hypothetical protein